MPTGTAMIPLLALGIPSIPATAILLSALTMSGSYATFADHASIIVIMSVASLLLSVQALAWAFGYRKSFADETKGA